MNMTDKRTLNSEGVDYRKLHVETGGENLYREGEGHEYGENSEDVLSREGKALGKGTGKAMGYAVKTNGSKTQIDYSQVDTKNAGGDYDINGRNGVGGRKRLMLMNEYKPENEYSADAVEVNSKTYKDIRLTKGK